MMNGRHEESFFHSSFIILHSLLRRETPMRRMKYLCWLPAALAVLWASCAPVDAPSPRGQPDATDEQPSEATSKPLPPVRGGLRERIEAAMRQVWSRELRTDNGFWTIFHAIL